MNLLSGIHQSTPIKAMPQTTPQTLTQSFKYLLIAMLWTLGISIALVACSRTAEPTSSQASNSVVKKSATAAAVQPKYSEEQALPNNTVVDRLVVHKSERLMSAYAGKTLLKNYIIVLGANPVGHKQFEGDERTPEGLYTINDRNPNSCCHKNLGISYPNAQDIANAKKLGKPPGGAIKIHGLPNGQGYIGKAHRMHDWTNGCIGVTDEEVDELYRTVKVNAPIEILP